MSFIEIGLCKLPVKPASMYVWPEVSPVLAVTAKTGMFLCGHRRRISETAVNPSMLGIRMSINTKSNSEL